MFRLKNENDIKQLKISGKILASVLEILKEAAKEGVKLSFLDELARRLIGEAGGKPAFLGYKPEGAKTPYPASICASVNEVVVHGLPGGYVLKKGDVLKIDAGVSYDGYITDSALTVAIPPVSSEAGKLIAATEKSLYEAINVMRSGGHLGDIGAAVESVINPTGFKIIKNLTGHGVGFELHEDPSIYNFGNRGEGIELKEGMVLAIEPMVSISSSRVVERKGGSLVTEDGSLSAHFEHTVAITEKGAEVLTSLA
ncbi:type I methionyl aminopeptidase [Candidatus Jorgensenbacteria bacterium GWC1_48_12]|uniref:Methionine aminopeptidase n=1 Tax=Candidatus Jorgensenbacteria bacterium GWC1_48_12 TaxID=1798469 RepID=A0A1F6BR45_9BACT|nr:MAG: type I methionyl aminopeptidase [Candidatus Jorgensenbacteria bacterium GWC1_48_12]